MSIPGVSIEEATGVPPLPDAGILSRVAVIAPANAGTFNAKPTYGLTDLSEFDKGVLVRHGKHLFAETKTPIIVVRCNATNPGNYGTIDVSGVSGTAVATAGAAVPTDEAELYVKVVTGFTVGVTGGQYRRSDSNGREGDTNMPIRDLGTATTIAFDDVNAEIDLGTGTYLAGDVIRLPTIAPAPNDADLVAAFDKLKVSPSKPGMILFPGRTDPALGITIQAGLDTLAGRGIFCPVMVQPRAASIVDEESFAEHVDNVEAEWLEALLDKRIEVVTGDYLCTFNDGARLRQRYTGYATHMMTRAILTEYFRTTWERKQLDRVTHLNSSGVPIGWDESNTPNKPRRIQVLYEVPGTSTLVPSFDMTLFDPDNDRTQTFREQRVVDQLKRIVNTWGSSQIGLLAAATPIANTTTGTLNNSNRLSLQQSLAAIIDANMGGTLPDVAIVDTDKPDLVAIDPIVDIAGAIVSLRLTVNFTIISAIGRISAVLSVRTGS